MTPDVWLIAGFALSMGASYCLWCFERLPRTRRLLAILSILSLGAGVVMHDYVLPKQPHAEAASDGY
jgi:peptidoglycan/LPS O-acetylase OafA/YrhL